MNMSADQKTLQSAPTDTCRTSGGRGREGGWGGDGQDTATKVWRESLKASRSPLGGRLVTFRRRHSGIQRNEGRREEQP